MQEKNKKLGNFFKKIKKIHLSFGFDGDRDWVTVFILSVVLFVTASIWGGYLYYYVGIQEDLKTSSESSPVELINEKDFQSVLLRYEEKKKKFDDFSSQKPTTPDPAR